MFKYKTELDRLDSILQYELLCSKSFHDDDVAYRRYRQSCQQLRLQYAIKYNLRSRM